MFQPICLVSALVPIIVSHCMYIPGEWLNVCVCNLYQHACVYAHAHICVMNIITLVSGKHFLFDVKPWYCFYTSVCIGCSLVS
jgi:hypothetical protein